MSTSTHQLELNTALSGHTHLQDELQQPGVMAMMGQHVAGVAHEMRNLLAIIQLQARMLYQKQPDTPQFQESLAIVQDQAKRMAHLVDNLLAFGDLRKPQMEHADVNALLRYVVSLQADQSYGEPFQVTTNLDANLPQIQADPFQLEQVFVNLINNAREAMTEEQGPRELVISTATAHSRNSDSPKILIRFADNGPGIPPEVMPYVFDPFFTTKKPGKGVGLGLSLCERIIQAHNGRIWAENTSGGGAVFVLELPVLESVQPAEPDQTSPPAKPRTDLSMPTTAIYRILVIDDEPAVTKMVKEILGQVGFRVTAARTGYQALSALEEEQIDLIISDLRMPEMDGQSLYRLVVSRHPHLARRIVFSSGDSSGRHARAFLKKVGCAWISKPFQVEELLHLVYRALQDSRTSNPQPEVVVEP